MCLINFEEKAETQDQQPLSLNRDRNRLKKYWAIVYFFYFHDKEIETYLKEVSNY